MKNLRIGDPCQFFQLIGIQQARPGSFILPRQCSCIFAHWASGKLLRSMTISFRSLNHKHWNLGFLNLNRPLADQGQSGWNVHVVQLGQALIFSSALGTEAYLAPQVSDSR